MGIWITFSPWTSALWTFCTAPPGTQVYEFVKQRSEAGLLGCWVRANSSLETISHFFNVIVPTHTPVSNLRVSLLHIFAKSQPSTGAQLKSFSSTVSPAGSKIFLTLTSRKSTGFRSTAGLAFQPWPLIAMWCVTSLYLSFLIRDNNSHLKGEVRVKWHNLWRHKKQCLWYRKSPQNLDSMHEAAGAHSWEPLLTTYVTTAWSL